MIIVISQFICGVTLVLYISLQNLYYALDEFQNQLPHKCSVANTLGQWFIDLHCVTDAFMQARYEED